MTAKKFATGDYLIAATNYNDDINFSIIVGCCDLEELNSCLAEFISDNGIEDGLEDTSEEHILVYKLGNKLEVKKEGFRVK